MTGFFKSNIYYLTSNICCQSLFYFPIFNQPFGNLNGIQGSTFFNLVTYTPEGEAFGIRHIFTDSANIHIVHA